MTAAYRLRGIGWFGGCVAAVLGFYLISLHVAGERKKLDLVNRRIAAAERDIRALETEFDTRANMVRLEKWNGDMLALAAPVAGQFVSDEAALAALDVTAPVPAVGGQAGMRQAALVVPAGMPQQPAMTLVAADAPRQAAPVAVARVAAVTAPAAAGAARASEVAAARAVVAVAKVRPEAVALLDRKLLSDSTLGDILSGARTEAGRRR